MTKLTIELPPVILIERGGGSVELPTKTLSPEMVARLVIHGAIQKVGDAAANSAKLAAETGTSQEDAANGKMRAVVDCLVANDWGIARGSGDGASEETRVARSVVRLAVKAKFGAKSPEWATFTGLDDDAQNAKLDAWFAEHEATFAPAVADEMERRAAKRAAKAGLAKAVTFKM